MSNGSTAWVTGWMAFIILLAFVYSEGVTNIFGLRNPDPDATYCEGGNTKNKADIVWPPGTRTPAAVADETPLQSKQSSGRDSANCIQWRAAVAAESQARYTKFGIWVLIPTLLAASFAAIAGWRTVRTMQVTARRELRAYVSFLCRGLANLGTLHPITLDCVIENHGATPAFKINYVFDIGVLPDPLPQGFRFPAPTITAAFDASLFPGGENLIQLSHSRPLTVSEHANAMAGTHRLHIWGTMTYEDVFQIARPTKLRVSAGGPDLMAALTALATGRPATPCRVIHGAEHNQIQDGSD
jgi:hypothetical protein